MLRAFSQAQSALQTLAVREREGESAAISVVALNEAALVARIQHTSGLIDQVAALQAQRAAIQAQVMQTAVQLQTLEAAINTYQTVGGGWGGVQHTTTENHLLLKK